MIREAKLGDSEAIAKIIVEAWQGAYTGIIDQKYVDDMNIQHFVQIMSENIQQKKEKIFIYEENQIVKGFISGKFTDYEDCQCETVGFYVLPKYQGMGIGSKLLRQIQRYFSDNNCRKMILWTLKGAKNNSFYKNNGGEITAEKMLKIGDKDYPGVGFSFDLSAIANELRKPKSEQNE